jgi:hypothetical protein
LSTPGDARGFTTGNAVFDFDSLCCDASGNAVLDEIGREALPYSACISCRAGVTIFAWGAVVGDGDFAQAGFRDADRGSAPIVSTRVAGRFPFGIFYAIGAITDEVYIAEVFIGWAVCVF